MPSSKKRSVSSYIITITRSEVEQKIRLQPGQPLTEHLVNFHLTQEVNEILGTVEAFGPDDILSLTISTYPLHEEMAYLITVLFKSIA